MKNHRSFASLSVVIFLICAQTVSFAFGSMGTGLSKRGGEGATEKRYAYAFDCSGAYLKIDTSTRQIAAQGKIWESAARIKQQETINFDGCLLSSVQVDADAGLLYAVVAREGKVGALGRMRYRVVALQLPTFKLVKSLDLIPAIDGSITILLTPDRRELLLSYSSYEKIKNGEGWHNVLARYLVPAFKEINTSNEFRSSTDVDPNPLGITISSSAYWSKQGRLIDGDRVLDEKLNLERRFD